ncbi:NUDIX hydrolase [Coleofasciculus sp. H7-2]|uniref:NUDIX hydrolase n=1 Tax=Coleofasciculus sp. H7-2 TaxID=3351545 RepID=UPI0036700FAD
MSPALSAIIPYRIKDGKIEVLLITSSTGKRWVIPKGMIEPFMTPQASAAKEAWEEAGIVGQVLPTSVGTYEYQKWGGTCRVEVFLMQVETVLEVWPEASVRKRQWVSVKQAVKRIEEAELKRILIIPDTFLTLQSPLE